MMPAKQAGAKPRYALGTPYGLAVDSKGLLYVADTKVGAVFIFNPRAKIPGLSSMGSTPSSGRIFRSGHRRWGPAFRFDGQFNHVLVFSPEHKLQGQFGEGRNERSGGACHR